MKHSETTPLVATKTNAYVSTLSSIESGAGPLTTSLKEIGFISKSSIPLIITFFLQYSLTVASIFSVGHLGKTELAAVSLATMTFNVTVSIFIGMATCLDTLCSQAYGAKKHSLVGLQFQRCTAMILVFSIPIMLLWYYSGSLLKLIVPENEKDLTDLAQTYLRIVSFGAPGYIFFETGKRFLQCQGIYHAGQYSLFIVTPINAILNYLLVWDSNFGVGFKGAPAATAISYWLMSFVLLAYTIFIDGKKCWNGLQIKAAFDVSQWSSMISLALNGTAMLLSEMIAFEILTLSASRFGTTALAAQSIVSTMATLAFQVPFGVSVAISTRIANYVGAGELINAKIANKTAYYISFIVGLFNFSVLVLFRYKIANLFSEDARVIQIAQGILFILGVNQLYDCPNVIFAGCLRGQGRQKIGSSLNLVSYYMIAVPAALIIAFVADLKLVGLWIGLGIGIICLAISEGFFLYRADWDKILFEASRRNNQH